MRELLVFIEVNGIKEQVGIISGSSASDAVFSYSDEYLSNEDHSPISLSMPLREAAFDSIATRAFFEGLLPEGFTRRSVAEWMHVDESDYLSILAGLGRECIGAVQVIEGDAELFNPEYRKLSKKDIKELASEGATESTQMVTESRLSLAGASGKVGLYRDANGKWYLPIGDAPSTHIVKQSHVRLENIVLNERLVMMTAAKLGIEVPESFVLNVGEGKDQDILFTTKRYDRNVMSDRVVDGLTCPYRQHQEDFAQALGIQSANKYEKEGLSHFKSAADLIRFYSANPIEDITRLWNLTVFNLLIGNTDNHIKNLSLIYSPNMKSLRLAPAYDLISATVYRGTTRNMAFNIGGKYHLDDIGIKDLEVAAKDIGISAGLAIDLMKNMRDLLPKALSETVSELTDELGNSTDKNVIEEIKELQKQILQTGAIRTLR